MGPSPLVSARTSSSAAMMFAMEDGQFQLVYNVLSFSLASMMATTLFLWQRVPSINDRYRTALIMSGMVTFIASYHYFRIFNSWTEAYVYSMDSANPKLTGVPFNDAYRYMDWLMTVPLLLIEIILVMKLSPAESAAKCQTLGCASAIMILLGYPGELIVNGDLGNRWFYWGAAMIPFCYIVNELLFGLAEATASESNGKIKALISRAQTWTLQLAHVPCRLRVPNDRFLGSKGCGCHPVWVLRVGHHFEVRGGIDHLQHHEGKV